MSSPSRPVYPSLVPASFVPARPSVCPVCHAAVPGGARALSLHVNKHLDTNEQAASITLAHQLQSQESPPPPSSSLDNDIFPTSNFDHSPSDNTTNSISHPINSSNVSTVQPSLRGSLSDSAERFYPDVLAQLLATYNGSSWIVRLVHVCTRLDFYSSNVAGWGWDCGFRNIQNLTGAILAGPGAQLLATQGVTDVPSIPEIAGRIEAAWRRGFDPSGAADYDGALADKKEWIGATEALVLFRSLGLSATQYDFDTPAETERKAMFTWVYNQFESRCKDAPCALHGRPWRKIGQTESVLPMFCQWHGHSVTIVGAEKTRTGDVSLLILDPSRGFYTDLVSSNVNRRALMRRSINHPQFKHPRFQIVMVSISKGPRAVNRRAALRVFGRVRGR